MRPRSLDELVGQQHLLAAGSPLRRLDRRRGRTAAPARPASSCGDRPAPGKTTLASLVSTSHGAPVRRALGGHRRRQGRPRGRRACPRRARHARPGHRAVRRRGAPVLQDPAGRSAARGRERLGHAGGRDHGEPVVLGHLAAAVALARAHALAAVRRRHPRAARAGPSATRAGSTARSTVSEEAVEHLLRIAGGDARRALTSLEAAAGAALDLGSDRRSTSPPSSGPSTAPPRATTATATSTTTSSAPSSRACRGSDVDAALHYLARMLEAGEDPRFIARRLVILASEDVGLADPTALQTATAAAAAIAAHRAARGPAHPRPGDHRPRPGPEVQRRHRRHRRGRGRRAARAHRPGAARTCATAHYARASDLGHGVGYVYPHDLPGAVARPAVRPRPARRPPLLRADAPRRRGAVRRRPRPAARRARSRERGRARPRAAGRVGAPSRTPWPTRGADARASHCSGSASARPRDYSRPDAGSRSSSEARERGLVGNVSLAASTAATVAAHRRPHRALGR